MDLTARRPSAADAGAAPAELPRFSRAEVAKHTTEGDLWLILRGRDSGRLGVYNLSEYVDDHPGGDAIFRDAGGDATRGLNGPQHPPTVHDLITEYLIGYLEEADEREVEAEAAARGEGAGAAQKGAEGVEVDADAPKSKDA